MPRHSHTRDDPAVIVRPGLEIPTSEFELNYVRSSGPGGQNVNKVNTKVQLRWPVSESESLPERIRERFVQQWRSRMTNDGELIIASERYRDQARNVGDCYDKLSEMIDGVVDPPKKRKRTRPSRGAKERRLKAKKQRSQRKSLRQNPKLSD
ncbi:alternative ribosome rescue aminoacyl-tRNA hydrolase ArfB [Thalassoroseus pseudoceratinae]|uniref:alternative ribosome rescue aminoacyl-tRNA hydrolase ArfB n=1 Tax=Thalassoroseus pseudoceratinae TaxID=2713176 RepID=UPI0014223A67|nr:alternative ribosome rescue aminoacyl-tRNA hydrolase ArfB [Thalassoroseus pseudoceratinae]